MMSTLDRYIGMSIAKGFLLVACVLMAVFSLVQFVEELEDVGEGVYQTSDALLFILLTIPNRLLELAPITALLGCIVALGMLARGSELIAMRAGGMSMLRLIGSAMKTGVVLMVAVALSSQFVAPPIQQTADKHRSLAVSGTGTLLKDNGFWSRDGHRFFNVREMRNGRIPTEIDIYEFDTDGRLHRHLYAARADTEDPREWRLVDVGQKIIDGQHIVSEHFGSIGWEPFLTEREIRVLVLPVRSLSLTDLYQYIQYLEDIGQDTDRVELTFWQKLTLPLRTGALMLLALPFVFGSLRTSSFGKHLMVGIASGLAFYLLDQITANLGLLMSISAPVTAFIPIVVVAVITIYLLRRVR